VLLPFPQYPLTRHAAIIEIGRDGTTGLAERLAEPS
jgi:hypothetical protein